jgi:hypothetical protein
VDLVARLATGVSTVPPLFASLIHYRNSGRTSFSSPCRYVLYQAFKSAVYALKMASYAQFYGTQAPLPGYSGTITDVRKWSVEGLKRASPLTPHEGRIRGKALTNNVL